MEGGFDLSKGIDALKQVPDLSKGIDALKQEAQIAPSVAPAIEEAPLLKTELEITSEEPDEKSYWILMIEKYATIKKAQNTKQKRSQLCKNVKKKKRRKKNTQN